MSNTSVNGVSLIGYPKQALFGRKISKEKIYARGEINARLKERFVAEVEQIFWQYKLAPETINIPAKLHIQEVQIFHITSRTPELSFDIIRSIDETVPFPIIFELEYNQHIKTVAAYKHPNLSDAKKWIIGNYFSTDWIPAQQPRDNLPIALDLVGLYEALLKRLIPFKQRPEEQFSYFIERVEDILTKQRDIEKTHAKLIKEKQFNRKVEINSKLRELKTQLEELSC